MKRAFAIFLLGAFLFNLGGYYLVFWGLQAQASKEFSQKIENGEVFESETFEIKIPISLPYPLQNNGFEKQSGRFEYKGEHFEIVKQKYENDMLTIVCVKDTSGNELEKVMDSFSEKSADHEQSKGTLNIAIKILQEYVSNGHSLETNISGCTQPVAKTPYSIQFNSVNLNIISPPPRA